MSFDSDITESLADLFESAGTEAVLTSGAIDTDCHVDIIRGVALQPDGFAAQVSGDSIIVEFLLSEIVTEPERGNTITVGSTVYTVDSAVENDGYMVKAIVREG